MPRGARVVAVTSVVVGAVAVGTAAAAGLLPGSAGPGDAGGAYGSTAPSSAAAPSRAGAAGAGTFRSPRTYPAVALPVRLRIPRIRVNTSLVRLGRTRDGQVAVPERWGEAGWYAEGPRPGQAGPAVLLGHVDSATGPAVFYRLEELRPGDEVEVDRADGSTVAFRVTGTIQVAKSRFPSDLVYAPTLQPALRLVTCGGAFDHGTGHYRDNIIVAAVPA